MDVFVFNIIDKYVVWLFNLEDICFVEFVFCYIFVKLFILEDEDINIGYENNIIGKVIRLKDGMGMMRKRNVLFVFCDCLVII